jgi:TonB family protein
VTLIQWIYLVGVACFAVRLILQLLNLRMYLRKASPFRESDNCKIVESREAIPSFSFFRCILLGNASQLNPVDKEQIIAHESVHVSHLHSLDLLLIEGLGILFWFNPAIKIYKQLFKSLHEFLADKKIIENHDAHRYVSLLTKVALLSADFPLANHFNNSLTLKRIMMMKTGTRKMKNWKTAALLPVFVAFVFMASCQDQVKSGAQPPDDVIYTVVDEQPTYVGGLDALVAYLQKEMKYPENARTERVEGKVFVSFIVTKEGSVVSPAVIKGVREDLDKEALRVVSGLPKWNPGRQKGRTVSIKFVLPVNFKL